MIRVFGGALEGLNQRNDMLCVKLKRRPPQLLGRAVAEGRVERGQRKQGWPPGLWLEPWVGAGVQSWSVGTDANVRV